MTEQIIIRGLSRSSKITGELDAALQAAKQAFDKPDLRTPHYKMGIQSSGRTFSAERLEDGSIAITCTENKSNLGD